MSGLAQTSLQGLHSAQDSLTKTSIDAIKANKNAGLNKQKEDLKVAELGLNASKFGFDQQKQSDDLSIKTAQLGINQQEANAKTGDLRRKSLESNMKIIKDVIDQFSPEIQPLLSEDPSKAKKAIDRIVGGNATLKTALNATGIDLKTQFSKGGGVEIVATKHITAIDIEEMEEKGVKHKYRVGDKVTEITSSATGQIKKVTIEAQDKINLKRNFVKKIDKQGSRYTRAVTDLNTIQLIESAVPTMLGQQVAMTQLPRLFGEVGNLTENEQKRFASFGGIYDKMQAGLYKAWKGKLSKEQQKMLIDSLFIIKNVIKSRALEDIQKQKNLETSFGVLKENDLDDQIGIFENTLNNHPTFKGSNGSTEEDSLKSAMKEVARLIKGEG